ncbi:MULTISPECIES: hypothetical protein [unclassified Sphingopyxis]|jgi:hypothetical protein|uniref:hypothetical protein n=1 Tax=unclassified Sphingopyxis TaxID=2614943 RepID=UPI0006C5BC0E|nr:MULTISPECIES: hypothetical protein [unclassified Sphingopyxis]USI78008.1 hypothetical protein KEC45_03640 [Sphingopyxis sp. USTB-05]GAO79619.1 hypothetical protein SC1_02940 [Sphingopyxis sp. C-1]
MQPISDAILNDWLELGEEIETRADGDLNGDGDPDTVYVVASPDTRTLHVLLSYRSEVDLGHEPAGSFKLEPDRLGAAALTISKGVLTIRDLTGGTTAMSATYRYRAATTKGGPRMRLIGLDATVYSRTYAHDGNEMSWNVATGDTITSLLKLATSGDRGYDKQYTRKFKRPVRTIYMEDTPGAEEELVSVTRAK